MSQVLELGNNSSQLEKKKRKKRSVSKEMDTIIEWLSNKGKQEVKKEGSGFRSGNQTKKDLQKKPQVIRKNKKRDKSNTGYVMLLCPRRKLSKA
jgi:hypothetical protein